MTNLQESTTTDLRIPRRIKILMLIGASSFLIPAIIYTFVFWILKDYPFGGTVEWAHFSTYVSGIATPFIAFCSVILFTHSINIQRDEMSATRRELANSTKLNEQSLHNQQKLHSEQLLVSHIERRVGGIDSAIERIKLTLTEHHSPQSLLVSRSGGYAAPVDVVDLVVEVMDTFNNEQAMSELSPLLEQYGYCCKLISKFIEESDQLYIYEKLLDDAEGFRDQVQPLVQYTYADDQWLNDCLSRIDFCIEQRHEVII